MRTCNVSFYPSAVDPQTVRVVLELESTAEVVRGSIYAEGVKAQPFYGWMELAARLQQACADGTVASLLPGAPPHDGD